MRHANCHDDVHSHEKPLQWQMNYDRVAAFFHARGNAPAFTSEIVAATGLSPNEWKAVSSKAKACFVKTPTMGRMENTKTYRLTDEEYAADAG